MLQIIENHLPAWPRKMPNQCQARQKQELTWWGFNITYLRLKE